MNDGPRTPFSDDSRSAIRRAASLRAAGDRAGAAAVYRDLTKTHPREAGLWALLGDVLRDMGDPAGGAVALQTASALLPNDHDIAVEWALAELEAGNAKAALAILGKREHAMSNSARGQSVLADAYRGAGHFGDAIKAYRRLLALTPDNINARISLGVCMQETGDLDNAIDLYETALKSNPDAVDALTNLGLAISTQGHDDKALPFLQRAAQLDPHDPATHYNLGTVLQKLERTDAAIRCFERAIAIAPQEAKAWSNLGNARQDQLQLEAAITAHNKAAALAPDDAGIQWNRSMTLLLSGDLKAGFTAYEWRRRTATHAPPSHGSPRWDGKDPNGLRLLLIAEQGFGDAIQFVRYAPLLHRRGAEVIIQCHPKLVALFATLDGAPTVLPSGSTIPRVDAHVPLMSLPYLFETTIESVPDAVPYLHAPSGAVLPPPHQGQCSIGLCWTGNPEHPDNAQRSCPIEMFDPLFSRDDVMWRSLQFGPAAVAAAGYISNDPAWAACLDGFASTAAALRSLDLIITVDTATAHLAGALGLPVWLLLKFAPDWRWMTGRGDTPWYPSMRLFRQQSPGDWPGVIANVKSTLKRELNI